MASNLQCDMHIDIGIERVTSKIAKCFNEEYLLVMLHHVYLHHHALFYFVFMTGVGLGFQSGFRLG